MYGSRRLSLLLVGLAVGGLSSWGPAPVMNPARAQGMGLGGGTSTGSNRPEPRGAAIPLDLEGGEAGDPERMGGLEGAPDVEAALPARPPGA